MTAGRADPCLRQRMWGDFLGLRSRVLSASSALALKRSSVAASLLHRCLREPDCLIQRVGEAGPLPSRGARHRSFLGRRGAQPWRTFIASSRTRCLCLSHLCGGVCHVSSYGSCHRPWSACRLVSLARLVSRGPVLRRGGHRRCRQASCERQASGPRRRRRREYSRTPRGCVSAETSVPV
jgi:hypothetical protein